MLLLPDGTVLAADNDGIGNIGYKWYKLTPDNHGSYLQGTWSNLASMHYTRLFYSSAVLRDGRVFVAGGEYGTGTTNAEVYDPQLNVWTIVPVPFGLISTNNVLGSAGGNQSGFVDSSCFTLPDGRVLILPVPAALNGGIDGQTVIFDPSSNTLSQGPKSTLSATTDEQSFVKLPDGSELTVGVGTPEKSERYITYLDPPQGKWIADATVPVQLVSPLAPYAEVGPEFLLPNGNAFAIGGNPYTALYTLSGSTNVGHWMAGPPIPNNLGTADSGGAMMANGKILSVVGSYTSYSAPTWFYEYDYAANAFNTNIPAPGNPTPGSSDNVATYQTAMLDLPDGTVFYSPEGSDLYIYSPDSGPLAAGKPVIQSITMNSDGSYHLAGTGLNGISQGAAYGDDLQMDSNYSLVRLNNGNGNIHYGRTYNWSSTSVQTGSKIVSTEVWLPPTLLPGTSYTLQVVANGNASVPVNFSAPGWVNFNYTGAIQNGSRATPYTTLAQGTNAVAVGGTVLIDASTQPSSSHETIKVSKPMIILSVNGQSIIGN